MSSKITTKIIIASDTHGIDFNFPTMSADIAIHCGDLTDGSKIEEFRTTIRCIGQIKAPLKLAIAGNHDFSLDETAFKRIVSEAIPPLEPELVAKEFGRAGEAQKLFEEARDAGVVLLHEGDHQFTLANGALLTIHASPYTPSRGNMGFQYPPENGHEFQIADGTDIVVTHGPPRGIMDFTGDRERVGCPKLFEAVAQVKPQIHCFGHIHDGWGARRVTWRECYEVAPTHFTAIDNDKSVVIENLSTLRPSRFDSGEEKLAKEDRLRRYNDDGCVEVHQSSSSDNREENSQTLFVNAAMARGSQLSQLPWIVHIKLPAAI